MNSWLWIANERDDKPTKRFANVPASRSQPLSKSQPAVKILPNLTGVRTDDQYEDFLFRNRNNTVVVNFGSSWCTHCHQMFSAFIDLTKKFPKLKYAVAQVDYMNDAANDITHTPTFAFFKKGRRVDQIYGTNKQKLEDHIWLWSERD